MQHGPLAFEQLNINHIYRTPTGKLCKLVPGFKGAGLGVLAHFEYLQDRHNGIPDGFALTRENVRVLRVAATHPAGR